MADALRPVWRLLVAVAGFLAPWVFGAIVGAAYSVAGLVVVFTVAGTDGPQAAAWLVLVLLALFLAAVVAWGVCRCHRITSAIHTKTFPRHSADSTSPRGQR